MITISGFVDQWRKRLDQRMPDELRKRLNKACVEEAIAVFPRRVELEAILTVADRDTTADAAIRVAARRGLRQVADLENAGNASNELWGKF